MLVNTIKAKLPMPVLRQTLSGAICKVAKNTCLKWKCNVKLKILIA